MSKKKDSELLNTATILWKLNRGDSELSLEDWLIEGARSDAQPLSFTQDEIELARQFVKRSGISGVSDVEVTQSRIENDTLNFGPFSLSKSLLITINDHSIYGKPMMFYSADVEIGSYSIDSGDTSSSNSIGSERRLVETLKACKMFDESNRIDGIIESLTAA